MKPPAALPLRAGLALVALSCLLWVALPFVPLVDGRAARAAVVAGALVAAAEVAFWLGLALAGKPTWSAIKARGWRGAPRELARLFARGQATPPPAAPPRGPPP
ncbi:MAG TPA: transporter suffix domain-containing protein [Polyangiaceae bacterium]|nr:transporter suffix domain-containing protein [Polyangiaceae bacterium]